MALIVEDGTGVPDAEAYVDVAQVKAFAARYGVVEVASLTDEVIETAILQSTLYLEGKNYLGRPYTDTQGLAWPRSDVSVCCKLLTDPVYPKNLITAACFAAIGCAIDGGIFATVIEGGVTREKVNLLEVEYSSTGTADQPLSYYVGLADKQMYKFMRPFLTVQRA